MDGSPDTDAFKRLCIYGTSSFYRVSRSIPAVSAAESSAYTEFSDFGIYYGNFLVLMGMETLILLMLTVPARLEWVQAYRKEEKRNMQQLGSVSVLTLFLSGFFFTAYNAVIPGCLAETFFGKGEHTLLVLMLRAGCLLPLFWHPASFPVYPQGYRQTEDGIALHTRRLCRICADRLSLLKEHERKCYGAGSRYTGIFRSFSAFHGASGTPVHGHPHRMGADGADAPDFRRLNGRCTVRPDKSNDILVRRIFSFADFPDCGLFTVCIFIVVFTLYPEERPCVFPLG